MSTERNQAASTLAPVVDLLMVLGALAESETDDADSGATGPRALPAGAEWLSSERPTIHDRRTG